MFTLLIKLVLISNKEIHCTNSPAADSSRTKQDKDNPREESRSILGPLLLHLLFSFGGGRGGGISQGNVLKSSTERSVTWRQHVL